MPDFSKRNEFNYHGESISLDFPICSQKYFNQCSQ